MGYFVVYATFHVYDVLDKLMFDLLMETEDEFLFILFFTLWADDFVAEELGDDRRKWKHSIFKFDF